MNEKHENMCTAEKRKEKKNRYIIHTLICHIFEDRKVKSSKMSPATSIVLDNR
jgi:hypothetical protein